ncbi:MAG: alcohol dehydrogenase, partial [Armatimonadetes bacterium]|nr:alcohol dehydrogenase [Armatimonadota bacterium]
GRLSWFAGLPPNSPPAAVNSNLVHYRELTVVGAHGSTPSQNRAAIALLASGEVQAADLVSGSYPLAETPAAVAAMAGGKELKSVVQVSG